MTNFDKWLAYTDNLSSPQNYIEWTWRFIVGAALQRRVWIGADGMRLYPNTYNILVGKAGLGKSIVISPAIELLKFHKLKDFVNGEKAGTDAEKILAQKVAQANLEDAEKGLIKTKEVSKIDATLFPYIPDDITYEKLPIKLSASLRRINFTHKDKDGNDKLGIYTHCSCFMGLPELGSLFKRRTDNVVTFFNGMYDSPEVYEKETKSQGDDRVLRGCLSIIAGATPEFMEVVFNEKLLSQGFSSRTFFIFASKNRKNVVLPEPLSEEQKQYKVELLLHIKKLAALYGEVKLEPKAMILLREWWNDIEENRYLRSNGSSRLEPYYARKNIHVLKVAMAEHFSEEYDLILTVNDIEWAIRVLDKEEKNMHNALTFEGDNPLGKVSDKVLDILKANIDGLSMLDLLCLKDLWKMLPQGKKSLEEVMQYLIATGQILEEQTTNEISKVTIKYKSV